MPPLSDTPERSLDGKVENLRPSDIAELEYIESETKTILSDDSQPSRRLDIQFMRYVESAMTGSSVALETEGIADSKPTRRPTNKLKNQSTRPKKPRKKRHSKYEDAVKDYLKSLVTLALEDSSKFVLDQVATLSAKVIAEHLKKNDERFAQAKINCIEDRVRRTNAWKNRKETLKPVYNTRTLQNPLPRNESLPRGASVVKSHREE